MTSFIKIHYTLCVLIYLVNHAVTPRLEIKGRQHFFVACFRTPDGRPKEIALPAGCCLGLNVHAAHAGTQTPSTYLFPPTSTQGRHAVSAGVQFDVTRQTPATSAPLISRSFLQLFGEQTSARRSASSSKYSAVHHVDDAPVQPKIPSRSSQVKLQFSQRPSEGFPVVALFDGDTSSSPMSNRKKDPAELSVLQEKKPSPNVEWYINSKPTQTASKSESASFNEKDAAEGTEEDMHWYAMRTNFPPRYLRIVAKKGEAGSKRKWYTLVINFKPHVLKLTPE